MHSIQSFALSMIGIFIPIYFLTLNYSVAQVIKFYIAHYSFLVVFAFVAIYLARYIGLQQTILARTPFTLIFFGLLYLLPLYHYSIYLIAFFSGLESAMYWIPLHILFTKNTDQKEVGASTGKLFAFPQLLSMASPLLGGFIAITFGFKILLLIVFVFLLIAIFPLLISLSTGGSFTFSGRMFAPVQLASLASSLYHNIQEALHIKSTFRFEIKKGLKLYKENAKFFIAEIFDNMGEEVDSILWPIFVYLTLTNIAAVGVVGTLINAGSFLFTLLIGKLADKMEKKKLIKFGAMLLFLVWLARFYISQELLIYIISIIAGFITVLFLVPFTSYGYSLPKKDEIDEFFVFREIPIAMGRIFILFIALFFVNKINVMFLLAGLPYLYFLFF